MATVSWCFDWRLKETNGRENQIAYLVGSTLSSQAEGLTGNLPR
jgi:hypothetical protein